MQKKDTSKGAGEPPNPARKIRLSDEHRETANHLYYAFCHPTDNEYKINLTPSKAGVIRRHLTRLCRVVGIEQPNHAEKAFDTAMRAAYRSGEHKEADRIAEAIARALKNPVKERDARKDAGQQDDDESEQRYNVYLHKSAGILGYARGEILDAVPADDLQPGDPAVLWMGETDIAKTGRLVRIDRESVTLRMSDGEDITRERASLVFLGRVVGTVSPYTDEQQKRLTALRSALDALDQEDEQILRGPERCRLEREIYNIEQQALAWLDEDADEWPEVIGVKGGDE